MGLLFNTKSLSQLLSVYPRLLRDEIDNWPENTVLSASETQLIDCLVHKFTLDVPRLCPKNDWRVVSVDTQVDVSHDSSRHFRECGGPRTVPGQRIVLQVPFEGDADLFEFQPSTSDYNPPRARVSAQNSVLSFEMEVPHDKADSGRVKQEIDSQVASVDKYLEWMRQEGEQWNASLQDTAAEQIGSRKRRLTEQAVFMAELNIPLKQQPDSGKAISIPVTPRRRPKVRLPATPKEQYRPEPTIADVDYNAILEIISRLALSIERSPTTFSGLSENNIRDHILVSLNGHFEGSATGETFNALGKTDILIREQNKNAFVGECKFWKGPSELLKAIDQLLGYVTWRDTKTALVVFVKQKNFTSVLGKINECMPSHTNYKQGPGRVSETQFKYIFHQNDDQDRNVHLSVLVFHIASSHEPTENDG